MAEINDLNTTDASNTGRFPENQTPSSVNNGARALEGMIARWFQQNHVLAVTETGVNSLSVSLARSSLTNTASASGSTGYLNGLALRVEVPSTITAVPLLGINQKTKHPIIDINGATLSSSAIKAGAFVDVVFDASAKAWQHLGAPAKPAPDSIDGTMIALGSDAQGDIMYYDGTDWVILAAGTDGYYLRAKGAAAPVWETPSFDKNHIAGLVLTNDTDTEHDIQIATGEARDYADSVNMVLSSVLTKQIDATWSAGDDAGGMNDAETSVANTVYYIHLLSTADGATVDAGFDSSPTATNLLADTAVVAASLTKYRAIGAIVTDGTTPGNIIQFTQVGDYFRYTGGAIADVTDATITSNTFEDGVLSVPASSMAHIYATVTSNQVASATKLVVYVKTKGASDAAALGEGWAAMNDNNSRPLEIGGVGQVLTDSSGTVEYAALENAGDTDTVYIRTFGFTMLTRSNPL